MKQAEAHITTRAFDTSTPNASIALMHHGTLTQASLSQQTHAKLLVPTIQTLLNDAELIMNDVDTIVTTVGPGSFTGIRIGLATMQGFCLAREHTLKTCTSLQAMAAEFLADHADIHACEVWLGAGKGEAYTQVFERSDNILPTPANDITLQKLSEAACSNQSTIGNIPDIPHQLAGVNAATLYQLAPYLSDTCLDAAQPVYVRPPDAKRPQPFAWLANSA